MECHILERQDLFSKKLVHPIQRLSKFLARYLKLGFQIWDIKNISTTSKITNIPKMG